LFLKIDVHVGVLISEQAGLILQKTGMTGVYNAFVTHKPNQVFVMFHVSLIRNFYFHFSKGPACKISGLDVSSIKTALVLILVYNEHYEYL